MSAATPEPKGTMQRRGKQKLQSGTVPGKHIRGILSMLIAAATSMAGWMMVHLIEGGGSSARI